MWLVMWRRMRWGCCEHVNTQFESGWLIIRECSTFLVFFRMVLVGKVATHWLGLCLLTCWWFRSSLVEILMSHDSLMGSVFLSFLKTFLLFCIGKGLARAILYCICSNGRAPWETPDQLRTWGVANPDTDSSVNSDLDLDSDSWFPTIKKFQNWNIFLLRHPGVTSNLRTARTPRPSSSKHDISSFFLWTDHYYLLDPDPIRGSRSTTVTTGL